MGFAPACSCTDLSSAGQELGDVSCLRYGKSCRTAGCLQRTLDAFPACFLAHVMQRWHRLTPPP